VGSKSLSFTSTFSPITPKNLSKSATKESSKGAGERLLKSIRFSPISFKVGFADFNAPVRDDPEEFEPPDEAKHARGVNKTL
jgi:hypothetical protein